MEDKWIMKGLAWDNPLRIRTWQELVSWVNEVGFLPLFRNGVPGFSVEEHVSADFWWTGEAPADSWQRIAGRVRECFPGGDEKEITRMIGRKPAH